MSNSTLLIHCRLFGPENTPLLQVGFLGLVEVDTAYHVRMADLNDFKKTVSDRTWSAVQYYADEIKRRKVKVAFFSSTPQGGGVALMRHALLRFSHVLGTDLKWCVPLDILSLELAVLTRDMQVCAEATPRRVSGNQDKPQHPARRCA